MNNLKGTKTEQNLLKAFANESMASLKYEIFEEKAKQEGVKEATDFFKEAKMEERGHAKIWFELLNGKIPSTENNIEQAIQSENDEWTDSYENMAQVAEKEGFTDIAEQFRKVAKEEEGHEGELHTVLNKIKKPKSCGCGCCCED